MLYCNRSGFLERCFQHLHLAPNVGTRSLHILKDSGLDRLLTAGLDGAGTDLEFCVLKKECDGVLARG